MRLDALFAHAADLGLAVEWADLGGMRRGEYHDDARLVLLDQRLTRAQATATLAHELGHAFYGDRCSTPAIESRAWEYGASLAISALDYGRAEQLVGDDPRAIALELAVTPRLVLAWRDWYRRAGRILGAGKGETRGCLLDGGEGVAHVGVHVPPTGDDRRVPHQ